jgi:flagellin
MSDITLTAGIRQNLLSLQQTSADLETTQNALSTGKAVNSAADNPSAYFTSQNLTNTANSLSALLDQIGQGQQTISAATNGLTGLTSLLQQALSTAQQAQQAATGNVQYSTIAGTTAIANDTTQVTSSYTTANVIAGSGANPITASVQSTSEFKSAGFAQLAVGDTLTFQLGAGTTFTATFGASNSGQTFDNATGLAATLNAAGDFNGGATATATVDGSGDVVLTSNDLTNNFTTTYTAGGGGTLSAANFQNNTANFSLGSALTVTDQAGSSNTFYYVANNAVAADNTFTTNAGLAATINSASNSIHTQVTGTANGGGTITLASANNDSLTFGGAIATGLGFATSPYENNYNAQIAAFTAGSTLTVQVGANATHTVTFGTGAGEVSTKTALSAALGAYTDISGAFNSGNDLVFTPTTTSPVTIGGTAGTVTGLGLNLGVSTPTATVLTQSSTRSTLQTNYNGLLTQLNQLAGDSSYNGVNLLAGNNLIVDFNQSGTSSLTIAGVNFNSQGLGLSSLTANQFQDNNSISTVIGNINAAISSVQAQTETFGTNSGVITTRQSFETALINTLQTGASNLVAADQNQESANLLTEQTQQQLEISALSIANQANQSVLKLFG